MTLTFTSNQENLDYDLDFTSNQENLDHDLDFYL
jgi:hypothetical protein